VSAFYSPAGIYIADCWLFRATRQQK